MKAMKPTQYFALAIGIFFLLIGIMGFIPGLVKDPMLTAEEVGLGFSNGYGDLLGLFPVNVLHNVVHVVVGLLGIFASFSLDSSRLYSGGFAIAYGLIAVAGLIPGFNTTLGLMPIFGNNVWLNALTAAIAAYFGFFVKPDLLEVAGAQKEYTGLTGKK